MTAPLVVSNLQITFVNDLGEDYDVTDVIAAKLVEGVGEISTLEISIPRLALGSLYTDWNLELNLVYLYRTEENGANEIWRGYIRDFDLVIDEDGAEVLNFLCDGKEIELVWSNTYRGIVVSALSPINALTALVGSTGWTAAIEGSGFPTSVTQRFDDQTIYDAVMGLSKALHGFVRFDNYNEVVTISNTPPSTGKTIKKTSDPAFGILSRLTAIQNDRGGLVNQVVPRGEALNNYLFDIGQSSRTTPYTIQNLVKNRPTITSTTTFVFSDTHQTANVNEIDSRTATLGNITLTGRNRVVVVFVAILDVVDSSTSHGHAVEIGGQACQLLQSRDLGSVGADNNMTVYVGIIKNAPEGETSVKLRYVISDEQDVTARVTVIALQDVQQTTAASNSAQAGGTSTAPAVTLAGIANDLRLAMTSSTSTFTTPTSGASQTRLVTSLGTDPDMVVDSMSDITDSTISWTFGTSEVWGVVAIRLDGAVTYYIEDITSVNTFNVRVKELALSGFRITTPAEIVASANSLYDYAAEFLLANKDPKIRWNADILWFPVEPSDWTVGSEVDIEYLTITGETITDTLVIPKRTQIFDPEGHRRWEFELSSRNDFRSTFIDLMAQINQRLNTTQFNQV